MEMYEYNGLVGLSAISKEFGIPPATIAYRVRIQGLTIEQALNSQKNVIINKPPKKRKRERYRERKENFVFVGVKYPDLLSPLWKLALGISKDSGAKKCQ